MKPLVYQMQKRHTLHIYPQREKRYSMKNSREKFCNGIAGATKKVHSVNLSLSPGSVVTPFDYKRQFYTHNYFNVDSLHFLKRIISLFPSICVNTSCHAHLRNVSCMQPRTYIKDAKNNIYCDSCRVSRNIL